MVLLVWVAIIAAFLMFFFWATGLVNQQEADERFDAGFAIVEFGRAYPYEAIRNVIISADGEMVFLRLWTGRTGCMRRNGSKFLCHVMDPADVRVTQAAVSHQVRSLERHLGVTLFERLPRSLRLTEKGAAYLPPLRNSFDELAAATAGLFGPVGKRTLTLRVPISFMVLWLAPRLPRFTRQWPDISLRISTVVWAPAASDDLADVDIRFGDGNWPGFQSTILIRQPVIPVCAPELVAGEDDLARLQSLILRGPLLHVTGYENLWQRLVKPFGLTLTASISTPRFPRWKWQRQGLGRPSSSRDSPNPICATDGSCDLSTWPCRSKNPTILSSRRVRRD